MSNADEFDLQYAAEQLRRSRHPLRKLIKGFYLRHALEEVHGPTIDFGCGAGQILERLPIGSIGVEINPALVAKLKEAGLDVVAYNALSDDFGFTNFKLNHYQTMVISHVLEHFENSAAVIRKILQACARLGIDTVIAIVPGEKGYASDTTHKTFVTEKYLQDEGLESYAGFEISRLHYFPGDTPGIGRHFTFHELKIVYTRVS
jgi:2-polyprenyl-3-methyl-5-hydroxy-6-metoxy-1,4-benzoquinol methylase